MDKCLSQLSSRTGQGHLSTGSHSTLIRGHPGAREFSQGRKQSKAMTALREGSGCSQQRPTEDGAQIRGEVCELGQKTLTQWLSPYFTERKPRHTVVTSPTQVIRPASGRARPQTRANWPRSPGSWPCAISLTTWGRRKVVPQSALKREQSFHQFNMETCLWHSLHFLLWEFIFKFPTICYCNTAICIYGGNK